MSWTAENSKVNSEEDPGILVFCGAGEGREPQALEADGFWLGMGMAE